MTTMYPLPEKIPCQAENIDGYVVRGEVIGIRKRKCGEYEVDGESLVRYWSGDRDVTTDTHVVAVKNDGGVYDYPATKVESNPKEALSAALGSPSDYQFEAWKSVDPTLENLIRATPAKFNAAGFGKLAAQKLADTFPRPGSASWSPGSSSDDEPTCPVCGGALDDLIEDANGTVFCSTACLNDHHLNAV